MRKLARAMALIVPFVVLAGCPPVTEDAVSAPAAPSGLTAVSVSNSQIHLTWTDNSNNETGFGIARSPDGSTGWIELPRQPRMR
jgi:hypothetical protein